MRRPAAPRDSAAAGSGSSWRDTVAGTVTGLGYELVDIERAPAGLLRIFIDRLPGAAYPDGGESVTVDDCERVTRQLQYALEVDGVDYARLEVSSPGLDRPLRREADYERFAGREVSLTLKLPFQGRKVWRGVLGRPADGDGWCLVLAAQPMAGKGQGRGRGKGQAKGPGPQTRPEPADGQPRVLGFALDEVREARLVPVVDFKGRRSSAGDAQDAVAADPAAAAADGG